MPPQTKSFNGKISIIYPCYNGAKFLRRNLNSIRNLEKLNDLEVIIVDNNSEDESCKIIESFQNEIDIKIIKKKTNFGFGEACNIGVNYSKYDYLFITNQDVIFPKDFFLNLINLHNEFKKKTKLIISPAIRFEDDGIHYFGAKNHILGFSYTPSISSDLPEKKVVKKTKRFSGGSLFIKREDFLKSGGFDQRFFMYYEDTDLSMRFLRRNYKIYTTSIPYLTHQKHKWSLDSFKYFLLERNRFILIAKNFRDIKKNIPFLIIFEIMLIFHSILIKKFNLRVRIYYDIFKNYKLLKRIRKESKKEAPLLPNGAFSRNLDFFLMDEYKDNKMFKKLLLFFNYLLSLI